MKTGDGEGLAVGVDAGGTWVRVVALRGERVVARAKVANEGALSGTLPRVWRERGWKKVGHLVVAARGVWTLEERRTKKRELARLAGDVIALSDVEAAHLGALGIQPGILVLAGTGSIVLGLAPAPTPSGSLFVREGGLGPLLGDEGSGFWIGREWLRRRDLEQARDAARRPDAVARIAALARGVIARAKNGARIERRIVHEAQDHLAEQTARVARRIEATPHTRSSWAGSVMSDEWFRGGVRRALTRRGVRLRWVVPELEPVMAAARLAADSSKLRASS